MTDRLDADLDRMCVPEGATVREALLAIDRGAARACLVVDGDRRLKGILTDGDVRRAMLQGASLEDHALPFATPDPTVVDPETSRAHVLDLMRARRVTEMPVVDAAGRLAGLHTIGEMVGHAELDNVAVIMAGGRGSRLGDLTRNRPKPLMTVAGRSILEWIVLNLVSGGVRDIYVSVNYLSEQIEEHLGDGSGLGCRIRYLREDPERPLGTAGALSLLHAERPDLDTPLLVMNGDLMVQFSASSMLARHEASDAVVTVATREYEHPVPFGVVDADEDGVLLAVAEKPVWRGVVNAGIYVVSPSALDLVPSGVSSTMPGLVERCLERGLPVGVWRIESDWIDVGTPKDLARAKGNE